MAMFVSGSSSSTGSLARLELYSSAAVGSNVLTVDGTQGRLFSVIDEMSGSIFSANTIAGLPVIEAFSDNKVTLGPYSSPVIIDSSGNISGSATSTGSFGYSNIPGNSYIGGKLGIGTLTPGSDITVYRSGAKLGLYGAGSPTLDVMNTSGNEGLRIYKDGTSTFISNYASGEGARITLQGSSAGGDVLINNDLLMSGNISGSSTSTGSFGKLVGDGYDVTTRSYLHFGRDKVINIDATTYMNTTDSSENGEGYLMPRAGKITALSVQGDELVTIGSQDNFQFQVYKNSSYLGSPYFVNVDEGASGRGYSVFTTPASFAAGDRLTVVCVSVTDSSGDMDDIAILLEILT